MLKIFCQECGSPNSYSDKKPNFCGSCGSSFPWNKKVEVSKAKSFQEKDKDEEDEESIDDFDLSDAFEFNINLNNSKSITLADVYKNPSIVEGANRIPPKNPKKNLETLRQRVKESKQIDLD